LQRALLDLFFVDQLASLFVDQQRPGLADRQTPGATLRRSWATKMDY